MHSRRGNRVRSGWLVGAQPIAQIRGPRDPYASGGFGFLFVFENGNPYASRQYYGGSGTTFDGASLPPAFNGKRLSMDDGVEVGDFIIMQPA